MLARLGWTRRGNKASVHHSSSKAFAIWSILQSALKDAAETDMERTTGFAKEKMRQVLRFGRRLTFKLKRLNNKNPTIIITILLQQFTNIDRFKG